MSLIVLVLVILSGTAVGAQVSWQPDEFPISFWSGPPATANSVETWRTVADANFTFVGPIGGYSVEANKKMLNLCQQVGLKVLVVDRRIRYDMIADEDWREIVSKVVKDYGSHPALYGYYLKDEPNYRWFESLAKIHAEFLKRDPAHLPYINLYPTYASVQQLGTPTYSDHLDKFLSIVKPTVLSYDHYCLLKDGHDRADYFENLALIREYAARYNVPPWNIILSTPHLGYRDPTDAEMRWQVYTSLAYGMKGIIYFTYWTSKSLAEQSRFAIVDTEGRPTKHYPIIKQLNAEMRVLGKLLLKLKSTNVYHTGKIPRGCMRSLGDLPIQLPNDQPLLIGYFKDARGDKFAMIVNRDYKKAQDVNVHLKGHVVDVVEISSKDGSEHKVPVTAEAFKISLEAGEGRLFRYKTHFDYPEPVRLLTKIDFNFENDREGWDNFNAMSPPSVRNGILCSKILGNDPYFTRGFLRIPPDKYSKVIVRMKMPKGKSGQFFWQTAAEPAFRDDKYLNFPIVGDDKFHDYEIPVGKHLKWSGQRIRAIRLDPAIESETIGQTVEIDFIRGSK